MLAQIAGMVTGITITILVLTTVIILVLNEHRERRVRQKMLHDERMLALEKGLPVPMDYTEYHRRRRPYVRGMVMGAFGIGLIVIQLTSVQNSDSPLIGIGTIFVLVGIALIIGDWMAVNRNKEQSGYPSDGPKNPY
jgi:hypothetical protein